MKGSNWEKGIQLSTATDNFDGRIIASEAEPLLKVQMDVDLAQTKEADIQILVTNYRLVKVSSTK